MAGVGAVQVRCPECDVVRPIAMVVDTATCDADACVVVTGGS